MNKLNDNSKLEQLYKILNKDLYSCYKSKINDDSDMAWNQAIYRAIRIINDNIESLLTSEFIAEEHNDAVGYYKLTKDNNVIEYYKLTDREINLCKLVFKSEGYITRDENGKLYWFVNKPTKDISSGEWINSTVIIDDDKYLVNLSDLYPECEFNFIKWEDKEPWEVSVIK